MRTQASSRGDSSYHPNGYLLLRSGPSGPVQLWSVRRLPFEPKGWLERMRSELRAAVRTLERRPDEVLYGVYLSNVDEDCDVENILFYNVGSSYFAQASVAGLRFERGFSEPPNPPWPLKEKVTHYQCYRFAKRDDEFGHWRVGSRLVSWDVECEPFGSSISAARIWSWVKRGICEVDVSGMKEPSRFGASVALSAPDHVAINPVTVVKPILDGIISAFHSHDGTMLELVSARIAQQLNAAEEQVVAYLMSGDHAVLGSRRVVYPRANSVQWNPADDRCVVAELIVQKGAASHPSWRLSGELFEVEPIAPPAPSPPASA